VKIGRKTVESEIECEIDARSTETKNKCERKQSIDDEMRMSSNDAERCGGREYGGNETIEDST
jgi:hypothetical protein